MSERLNDEETMETTHASGEDRLEALPNDLLGYLMSFLPSHDSVQTCVLGKRWSMLWKSVPALRINDPDSYDDVSGSNTFVNEFLLLRDPTPLNVCDISSDCVETAADYPEWADEAFQQMKPWLWDALSCQVQVLKICFPWRVIETTIISSHLKRLHLDGMHFEGCSLDFSSYKVLEVLEMISCDIYVNILSQTLRHLKINGGGFCIDDRIRISTPNLIGFILAPLWGWAPLLYSKSLLVTTSVKLGEGCEGNCVTVVIHHVKDVMLNLVEPTILWLWKVCRAQQILS
ncbi:hypothetical protein CFC21_089967 [Triticum aestivum]|uniref:F-box domain-containing protein n=2 Tax=Triticum aestivum TaxID=4565 RepID=A0A3B6PUA3_WHEAT|nr:hypothetical protein CFC21_089967 [Triticum aestivum]